MEKITFKKRFDWGLFGRNILAFIVTIAISIGVQSLLFRFSGLMFPSLNGLGIIVDAVLGAALVLPLVTKAIRKKFEGDWNLLLTMIAITGFYVCAVLYFNWFLFIVCVVLLLFNLMRLVKFGFYPYIIYTYMLYCIGTYVAMIINDLEPASDIYGFITISWLTFLLWFTSASHDCLKH